MIHQFAVVSPQAQLAQGVVVEQFSTIYEDVIIGENTKIGPNVVIYPGTRIGSNCEIFPGAVIGAVPQDLKFSGEYTTCEIGNNTVIRECVTIHRGTSDKMTTKIGNNCLLMGYVHVAHDCIIGNHVILANYTGLSGHVTIEDFAILEGKVAAQQFVTIGAHAFVGGASLIRKSVPPFVRVAREPLSYIGVNSVGLRRRNFTDEQVRTIEDIYRILFVQNSNVKKAVEIIESAIPNSQEKQQILNFIAQEERGIVRGWVSE
jgi:UDP-N-acetylglucosamine acyltransferase